jgi:membrane-bound ClpP family serine protease
MFMVLSQPWQSELAKTQAVTKTIEVTGLQVLPGSNAILLVSVLLSLLLVITRGGFRYFLAFGIALCLLSIALQCLQISFSTNAFSPLTQKYEALSGLASADPHLDLATDHSRSLIAALTALLSAVAVIANGFLNFTVTRLRRRRGAANKKSLTASKTKVVQSDPWAETSDGK